MSVIKRSVALRAQGGCKFVTIFAHAIESGRRHPLLVPYVGRRGAYLVRAAMRQLGMPLVVIGRNLEHPDFWRGIDIEGRAFGPDCLGGIGLLLAPALAEFKPRLILAALARGIAVIATEGCGLPPQPGLFFVSAFDNAELARAIAAVTPAPSRAALPVSQMA